MCAGMCVDMCEGMCIDACPCAHVHMLTCVRICVRTCVRTCVQTYICVDIFVHMGADVCVGMRKACKCPYTRALMRAHMCAGGRTPNPVDAKLAGAAVSGRIPAKRRPLPPLDTENKVLFSMLARLIALVVHASHRHQPQPDMIPAGLLS